MSRHVTLLPTQNSNLTSWHLETKHTQHNKLNRFIRDKIGFKARSRERIYHSREVTWEDRYRVQLEIAVDLKTSLVILLAEHHHMTLTKAKRYTRSVIWTSWTNILRRSCEEIATWKKTMSRSWFKRRFKSSWKQRFSKNLVAQLSGIRVK